MAYITFIKWYNYGCDPFKQSQNKKIQPVYIGSHPSPLKKLVQWNKERLASFAFFLVSTCFCFVQFYSSSLPFLSTPMHNNPMLSPMEYFNSTLLKIQKLQHLLPTDFGELKRDLVLKLVSKKLALGTLGELQRIQLIEHCTQCLFDNNC